MRTVVATPPGHRGAVGGPNGLALSVTPEATIDFSAPVAPLALRRQGKEMARALPDEDDSPIIIDMEAAMCAVEGMLVVGRVLSPYLADHKAISNALRGPWRLRGEAVSQRVTSDDGRFVITFTEEADRQRARNAGPWHYRNDAVILADFDGKGNPTDVRLAPVFPQDGGHGVDSRQEARHCDRGVASQPQDRRRASPHPHRARSGQASAEVRRHDSGGQQQQDQLRRQV